MTFALIRHHDDGDRPVYLSSWTMTETARCFVWMKHQTGGTAAGAAAAEHGTAADHWLVPGRHVDEHLFAMTPCWRHSVRSRDRCLPDLVIPCDYSGVSTVVRIAENEQLPKAYRCS